MLLTTSSQFNNVVALGRQQGYIAQGKISYQYRITLVAKVNPLYANDDTTHVTIYEIPKYSKFTSGSKNYYYMGETISVSLTNADIANPLNSNKNFTFIVKEGTLHKAVEEPSILTQTINATVDRSGNLVTSNYIDLPYSNVEDDGIELFLTYINEYGEPFSNQPWYKANQFLVDSDTYMVRRFIRVDDIEFKQPRIYFTIAGIGNVLRAGTIISANVLVSSGSTGDSSGTFALDSVLTNSFSTYSGSNLNYITTVVIVGHDEEDIESIRTNAPIFHNSANRAVTALDYQAIINRNNLVAYSQVWGGEEEIPMNLGHIYVSIVPSYRDRALNPDSLNYNYSSISKDDTSLLFMTSEELRSTSIASDGFITSPGVYDTLDQYKIITLQYNTVNPIYINFDYEISIIKYNLQATRQETNQSIVDIIDSYFSQTLEIGGVDYFHASLIKRVDAQLTDLSGLSCNLKTSLSIYKDNIQDSWTGFADEKVITMYLSIPYESYVDSSTGALVGGVLPTIATDNTIGGQNLSVDFSNIHTSDGGTNLNNSESFYFDVYLGVAIVGRYMVQNAIKRYIRIDLYINATIGNASTIGWINNPLTSSMFDTPITLNLQYTTENFRLFKNSFPRLTSISFV
jgi:hypothetical protein